VPWITYEYDMLYFYKSHMHASTHARTHTHTYGSLKIPTTCCLWKYWVLCDHTYYSTFTTIMKYNKGNASFYGKHWTKAKNVFHCLYYPLHLPCILPNKTENWFTLNIKRTHIISSLLYGHPLVIYSNADIIPKKKNNVDIIISILLLHDI
jgi:hypothetical protein